MGRVWPPKEMTLYLDVNEIQIEVKLKIKVMKLKELNSLVNSTQKELDVLCPGKVKVYTVKNEDGMYLVGQYESQDKLTGVSWWMEKIDKYFTSNSLFLEFFKQRQKWLNSTVWEKQQFKGHPSTY